MATDRPGHVDPITQGPATTPHAYHTNEMLMFRNRGPGIDPRSLEASSPAGGLAQAWEISPDGASITFKIRQGVKFHPVAPVNGRVMDIDDWKTSHDRHIASGIYRSAMNDILDHAEFPDANSMVWKLRFPVRRS